MMLNCPRFERPREKAICNGIETLSNQELIAVILRTGNKEMSVLNLASLLLEEIGGFQALKDVDYYQLTKITLPIIHAKTIGTLVFNFEIT